MFRHRRDLRRWAARMLFVWLFGIANSLALACMGASPTTLHHVSSQMLRGDLARHDGSSSKSNCQDFCEKSAISIPSLKSAFEKAEVPVMPMAEVAIACPVAAAAAVQLLLPRTDPGWTPPIRLAYLRLAL